MLIYEVNIKITAQIKNDFLKWIDSHIAAVLSSNNFHKALFFEHSEIENEQLIAGHYTVHYYLNSKSDLENYLKNFAPRLRQDGVERFGNQLEIERRLLSTKERENISN